MNYDKNIAAAKANGDAELAKFFTELQQGTATKKAKNTDLAQKVTTQDLLQQLVAARQQADLTQQQLAERLSVPQSTVARLETGSVDPRLSTLLKLAEALGVELRLHTKQ